jgi:ABC-type lipoprotein export system ATPase subunit
MAKAKKLDKETIMFLRHYGYNLNADTENDSKTTEEVMDILKMCVREFDQTLVMITHNDEIANIADRVITIKDGQILS